ncbi:MAG: hypothetical protein ACYS8Y_14625 [Planctomycetota bacterium]|jgi:hypothetical protein
MQEENLKKLLNKLAQLTAEPVRPGLAEDIKRQIPHKLARHRMGMDTINIIIDLRIGKLAAAAVIIITLILSAYFLRDRGLGGDGIYEDSKLLVKYCIGGEKAHRSDVFTGMSGFYEYLVQEGKEVVFYSDSINIEDSNVVLMHWKLSNDKYRIILADLSLKTVSAEDLIKLQAQMLQKK